LKLVSLLYDCDEELCPVMTLIGLNEASKRNNDELLYVFGENCLSILYFCDSQGAENKYWKLAYELKEEIEVMVETKTEICFI